MQAIVRLLFALLTIAAASPALAQTDITNDTATLNGVSQPLSFWLQNSVDVREFGAYCDNNHPNQDTAAFQAAFDWVANKTYGYTIVVPSGQCLINRTIRETFNANNGLHLVGAGKLDSQITFVQPVGAPDYNGLEITISGSASTARSASCCGTDGEFIDIENLSVISNPAVLYPIGTAFVLQGNFGGNTGSETTWMRHVLITNSGNINNSTTTNSGRNAWQNGILLNGLFGITMEDVNVISTASLVCVPPSSGSGTVSQNSTTLALTGGTSVTEGESVSGPNIPVGDFVVSVSGSNVTMANAATGGGSGTFNFASAGVTSDCHIAGAGVQLFGPIAGSAIPLTGFSMSDYSSPNYYAAAEYAGLIQGTGFSNVNLIHNDYGLLVGGAATSDDTATLPHTATLNNSTTLTLDSASGVVSGSAVIGANLPDGDWVTAVSGSTVTLAYPATAAVSEPVAFSQFPQTTASVTATAGSPTATVPTTTGITVGMLMNSPAFPAETAVVGISGTTLTLSNRSALASGSSTTPAWFTTSRVLWSPYSTDGVSLSGGGCDEQFGCVRAAQDPNSGFGFADVTMSGMNILQASHDNHAIAVYLSHSYHHTIYDNKVITGNGSHQQFLVCDTCNYAPNTGVVAYGNSTSSGGDQPQFSLLNSQSSSVHANQVTNGVLGNDTSALNTWYDNDLNGVTVQGLAGNYNDPSSTTAGALTSTGSAVHNVTRYVLQTVGQGPTLTFTQAYNNTPMNVLHGLITTVYGEATCQTAATGVISWKFIGHWNASNDSQGAFVAPAETDNDSKYVLSTVNPNLKLVGAIDTNNKEPVLQVTTGGSTANLWSCTADATALESN